jgi:hypothetical protein
MLNLVHPRPQRPKCDGSSRREFLLQPPRVDGTPRLGEGLTAVSEVVVPLQVR